MSDWRRNDRELLARILTAEAGNQGPVGMTAAGNVIMNRANSSGYGDGVRGVIMKPGQFSPMNSVTGYAGGEQGQNIDAISPSETAYMVADSLLSGSAGDITGGATHFYNPEISSPSWAQGAEFTRIGDHLFGRADAARGQANTTQRSQPMAQPMQQQQQPRGILEMFGVQKMNPEAQGETALPFYQRPTFSNLMGDLALGFNQMRLRPDEGLAQRIGGRRQQREQQAQTNRTLEYLKQQPGSEAALELIRSGASPTQALQAYQQSQQQAAAAARGEIREVDGKLVRLMPDGTVTELYAPESSAEATADMREYNLAQQQGFTGSFLEFIQAQKGGGLRVITRPDGTTEIVQGGPAGLDLTEGQSKATGFFGRSKASNQIASGLEQEGTQLRNVISGAVPLGNYLRTPEGQQYDQAKRDFINAVLRQESGAVIGESEFANADLQYFPQPGDGPEVIAQKRRNREMAVRALEVSAGEGAAVIQGNGAEAPASSVIRYDAEGNRIP